MVQLFTPGQEVVCLKDDWVITPFNKKPPYEVPKKNEIYHVDKYWPSLINGKWYFNLRQFPADHWFHEKSFAPVMPSELLEKELNEIFNPITI